MVIVPQISPISNDLLLIVPLGLVAFCTKCEFFANLS
jgi:hypothetical protein